MSDNWPPDPNQPSQSKPPVQPNHAQKRWHEISAKRHTHFCGAYWFNGFHEDGVKSGLRVCQSLGVNIDILLTTNTTAATTAQTCYSSLPNSLIC